MTSTTKSKLRAIAREGTFEVRPRDAGQIIEVSYLEASIGRWWYDVRQTFDRSAPEKGLSYEARIASQGGRRPGKWVDLEA
jgi:hypothetical protein